MDTGSAIVTSVETIAAAWGGKELIGKVLGPTAEYLGDGIKSFTEKRVQNVKSIFENASKKIKSDDPTVAVPPRVLQGVLNEGSYVDDFLFTEYFGGVLASSKSGISRDDRAASLNSLLGRMSTYQLRLHYIAYHLFVKLNRGRQLNPGIDVDRNKMSIFIPASTLISSMDFDENEVRRYAIIVSHSLHGLVKESLLLDDFLSGEAHFLTHRDGRIQTGGVIITPGSLGFELFCAAYGDLDVLYTEYLDKDFDLDPHITLPEGAFLISTSI